MRPVTLLLLLAVGCAGGGDGTSSSLPPGADLAGFRVARILVDEVEMEVYVAETPDQRAQGLMNATPDQIASLPDGTPRGMLFSFGLERPTSFWMRDTYVPLDLAYATLDGTIVEVHALAPLDWTSVPSGQPVAFALEVPAGTLAAHGLGVGSVIRP